MIRRIISIFVGVAILMSTYGSCFAADTGGTPSSWAKSHVERAIEYNLVPERLRNNYQKVMTREEFASLLVQTVLSSQRITSDCVDRPESDVDFYTVDTIVTRENILKQVKVLDFNFKDTQSEDVKLAYIMGFVSGTSDTTFDPDKLLTRQDAATMLSCYGSPESTRFNADEFDDYYDRYTDLDKAAPWARDAVNLAFLRHIIDGDASEADRSIKSKKKITLNPLGQLTREQAIVMMDKLIFYEEFAAFPPVRMQIVYLRGCVPYFGDYMGTSWEVSKDIVRAVSLSDRLKKCMNTYLGTAVRQFEGLYPPKTKEQTWESFIASGPRLGCQIQFITLEQADLIAAGKNIAVDIGFAEYEANNPNYIFEYRLKNNGFYNSAYYGGGKMLKRIAKRIK